MSEKIISQLSLRADTAFLVFAHTLPSVPTNPQSPPREAQSMIFINKDKELPFQILAIHAQNPTVVPALIEELATYPKTDETALDESQKEMLQFLLTALRELASRNLGLNQE